VDPPERLTTQYLDLQVIDTLCTECASLIENHEKIQVLSAVHYNLGKTLQDVENIVALPHEAGSAEAMLREDVQLMQVRKQPPSPSLPPLKFYFLTPTPAFEESQLRFKVMLTID